MSERTKPQYRRAQCLAEPLGLRERQKLDRLDRIKNAARQLFIEKGYDATTLRGIGAKAGVGAGTIFHYVKDKRDLLHLLFNEDHEQVTREANAVMSEDVHFLVQCVIGFRPYYRYFGRYPEFGRAILREATFYRAMLGTHAAATAMRSQARIEKTIAIARQRGEIRNEANDHELAQLIFVLYQSECRRWLASSRPSVEKGLAELHRALSILMQGLSMGPRKRG